MDMQKEIEKKAADVISTARNTAMEALANTKLKVLHVMASTLPNSVDLIQPTLTAYRKDSDECVNLLFPLEQFVGVKKLSEKGFLSDTNEVILIVHGFLSDSNVEWMHDMRKALLDVKDRLVLLAGWGKGAAIGSQPYALAAVNIRTVSTWLASFISELQKSLKNPYIWGIGHSLGAHLMGQTGRKCDFRFDRITGLDPAGPLFEEKFEEMQGLLPTDAKLVDCIHTDGFNPDLVGVFPVYHFGTLIPCGTIDFYPNFGLAPQPGCKRRVQELAASHQRAIEYFINSIRDPDAFKSNQELAEKPEPENPVQDVKKANKNMAQMGYYADKGQITKGLFYVNVNDWDIEQSQ